MKIVIAPDSYKESLSASEVAQAIEKGFREIFPDAQYVSVPVADGGEGTVEAMIAATQGSERHAWVTGPLGEKVNASWGISGDGKTAFIEMAAASGLELVPAEKRDPLVTTSRGTGELILQALESGATNIIIGIGGSATNDGGAGMVQALGAKLCDANGNEIGFGGGSLNTLNDIDISGLDPRLKDCAIRVACDVTNPLVGDNGASRIFGPQKGASEAMIVELDNNLSHYADVIKKALHVDVKDVPGAGAAGGMGAALMAFLVDIELFPMFFYPLSLAIELKSVSDFRSIINASWLVRTSANANSSLVNPESSRPNTSAAWLIHEDFSSNSGTSSTGVA